MEINIGINEGDRKDIADGLSKVLADSYLLYLRTQNYHWNVTGELALQNGLDAAQSFRINY